MSDPDKFDPRYEEEVNEFFYDYPKDDTFRDMVGDSIEITDDNQNEVFVDLLDEVGELMWEDELDHD